MITKLIPRIILPSWRDHYPLGKDLVLVVTLLWVGAYLLLLFAFYDLIPEKFSRDSRKIMDIMQGTEMGKGSFLQTALLLSLIPSYLLTMTAAIIGSAVIFIYMSKIRTVSGIVVASSVMMPTTLLNLLYLSKETIVILMTIFVLYSTLRIKNAQAKIGVILIVYFVYGYFVRNYYLLIALVFVMLHIGFKMNLSLKTLFLGCALALLFFAPESVFQLLQGHRDRVNYNALHVIGSDNRTLFFNAFPPNNPVHFIGNYFYAAAILNFPFLKFVSIKELVLFINIIIYGRLTVLGLRFGNQSTAILGKLFIAHILVFILFEPDLGSYFRHFSSLLLYLTPAFTLLENMKRNRSRKSWDTELRSNEASVHHLPSFNSYDVR
jgi:hypothetical protein